MKVKKENDRFFHELSFLKCPSYEELLEAACAELEIEKVYVEAIIKNGDVQITARSVANLDQDERLVVYLKVRETPQLTTLEQDEELMK